MTNSGMTVSLGFVDAHSHLRSTSYAEQGIEGATFEEAILRMSAMTSVPLDDDVFLACVDLLEKGVTTVQAMFHTFGDPDDYREALAATVRGIERSGIRALLILGTTDQAEFLPLAAIDPGMPDFCAVSRRLTETEFGDVVSHARTTHSEVSIGVGPVGPQWCSDPLLGTIGEIAQDGYRVHTHFLESAAQRSWAPGDPLARLKSHGLLGPSTSLAHAVWCTDEELSELSDLGVQLVTCPHSNRLLKAGAARVDDWLRHDITVGVGLDSADPSFPPLETARLALSPSNAEHALTVGGLACTGLPPANDSVTWIDKEQGVIDSVEIEGRQVVSQGHFHDRSAVDDARSRIADAMMKDRADRLARHSQIDALKDAYQGAIDEALR